MPPEYNGVREVISSKTLQSTPTPLDFAYTYALLGEKEHTSEWLEKAYEARDPWLYVKTEPKLDGVRSEPRFKDLLRQLGLPP